MEEDELKWIIASRGFTTSFAIGLLDNLFKVHSFGIGGLLTFIAATRSHRPYPCCSKTLLIIIFICLMLGLGTTLWSWKRAYEGQDAFSNIPNSKDGEEKHNEARNWALTSVILFAISATLFGVFLIIEL